jgi:hypothetical protein
MAIAKGKTSPGGGIRREVWSRGIRHGPWIPFRDAGAFAKARTGGVTPDLFPSPARLMDFLRAALDEEVRFKATAGLHHPLRGSYPLTGVDPAVSSGGCNTWV